MKFLIDAQLPRRLSHSLREAGHDSPHTLDLPLGNATPDHEVARIADEADRVVVSKDADFVADQLLRGRPARVLLVVTGNMGNRELLCLFETWLGEIVLALATSPLVELHRDRLVQRIQ